MKLHFCCASWTPWKIKKKIEILTPANEKQGETTIQERECNICNRLQQRVIKWTIYD